MKIYTGIGSRETPDDIICFMEDLAMQLARQGWTLRSGCADGADSAFERGAFMARLSSPHAPRPELYLPWPHFEGRRKILVTREAPQAEAYDIAEQHHPAWAKLSDGAKALHARNVHQILGPDVTTPVLSRFVVCWTKDAVGGGGTGQALRIARCYDVPTFDLADRVDFKRIREFLRS